MQFRIVSLASSGLPHCGPIARVDKSNQLISLASSGLPHCGPIARVDKSNQLIKCIYFVVVCDCDLQETDRVERCEFWRLLYQTFLLDSVLCRLQWVHRYFFYHWSIYMSDDCQVVIYWDKSLNIYRSKYSNSQPTWTIQWTTTSETTGSNDQWQWDFSVPI